MHILAIHGPAVASCFPTRGILWGIFLRLWVFFGYLRARACSNGAEPVPRHLFLDLFFGYPAPPGPDLFFSYLWAIFDFLLFSGLY